MKDRLPRYKNPPTLTVAHEFHLRTEERALTHQRDPIKKSSSTHTHPYKKKKRRACNRTWKRERAYEKERRLGFQGWEANPADWNHIQPSITSVCQEAQHVPQQNASPNLRNTISSAQLLWNIAVFGAPSLWNPSPWKPLTLKRQKVPLVATMFYVYGVVFEHDKVQILKCHL